MTNISFKYDSTFPSKTRRPSETMETAVGNGESTSLTLNGAFAQADDGDGPGRSQHGTAVVALGTW